MAEIGLVASLAGIVSLGLQVCKGLTGYYNSYSKAEDDVKCLCDETNSLTQTLLSFEKSLQDSRVNMDLGSPVLGLMESCRKRILDLDVELKKLSKFRKEGGRSMRRAMSRTVRALYPFQEDTLRKLRENISRINEILQQAASSVLIRQNNTIQDTIDRFYAKEESKEIIRWLDPPSPVYSHLDASSKHRQETGFWLLNSPEFAGWKHNPNSVLWLCGNAGCGKTILCSTIIDTLISDCENRATSGIAYFYFDFNNHSIAQDHNRLLRSLIEQLSSQSGAVPQPLTSLYQRCRNGTVQPLTADLVKTFRSIIGSFTPFYLVIDAVDESKEKQEFLGFLNTIAQWKLPQVHVLVTSRTEIDSEIRSRNWKCVTVAIEEHLVDADIQKHILATLEDDEVLNRWDPSHQEVIAKTLISGANGNFRWVACQLGALRECHTLAELEHTLNCLPVTLEETYERVLSVVDEKRREGICNVLRWLCFSARPIRLDEIADVMAIDFGAQPRPLYDPRRRLIDPERFFHTYNTLVHIWTVKTKHVQYRELRLAHLSVRDYLVSGKILRSPVSYYAVDSLLAHRSIAQTCLVYLQQFEKPLELASKPPESYCLARYAARFWPYHVQAVVGAAEKLSPMTADQSSKFSKLDENPPLIALIIQFLLQLLKVLSISSTSPQVTDLPTDLNHLCVELLSCQDAQLQSQIRFYDPDTPWIEQPDITRTLNALPSALYYAAHAGLTGSVKLLLAKGMDVNATGGRYGTALQAASCKGHTDVVALLLANGADVNLSGGDFGNALQGACSQGHESCAKLLLDHGADVNARGGEHCTALHAAAFNGHDHVAALLIEKGAEIDALDTEHRTPLIWAAGEGHPATVKLLLEHGSDLMVKDQGGWTALDESAPPGYDSIVQMLIEHDIAIIHSKDNMDYTSLHHTAGQRHKSTVQILLENGVDVNVQNIFDRTALFQAVASGHEDTVLLFLKFGVDIHIQDRGGWTVLHVAAYQGHASLGSLLLENGADINYGPSGWTALHIAVLRKNLDFVELLLEYDVDANRANDKGQKALDCLYLHGTGEASFILKELNIENPTATITGLRIAASLGRDARVRQLLERGADINAKDEGAMTALLWAADAGAWSTVRLLVENGADVNARSDWGTTAMTYVSGKDPDLEKLLLAHGFEQEQPDGKDGGMVEEGKGQEVLEEMRELLAERMEEQSNGDVDTLDGSKD